jgi:uncharacterized membrane protein YphA (DoxX/SURF4 family)
MHPNDLGRRVFGLGAIAFGILTVAWRDFNGWQQIDPLGHVPHRDVLAFISAAIQLFGGLAIQWSRTERLGAITLTAIYSLFALLWLPRIAAQPLVYDPWGNLFEQSSLVAGALIVSSTTGRGAAGQPPLAARAGYFLFGVCTISFTLEQVSILSATASFVPKWIPPGQMFWAVATTVFFALAAIALLSGFQALLAARLTTAMIVGFQFLVWLPRPFSDPHQLMNWFGNAQNLAIAGSAWIVADYLSRRRAPTPTPASAH